MARNQSLDFVKGVLILLVCIGHALQFGIYREVGYWSDPLFKSIYLFHMPLFMALSGYFSGPGLKRDRTFTYLSRKFQAYVVPILVWALIFHAVMFPFTWPHLGIGYLKDIVSYATGSLWFLWALFGSIFTTFLVVRFAPPKLFLPLYLLSFFAVLLLPEKGTLPLFKYMYPFFQIGYVAAVYPSFQVAKKHELALLVGGLAITVACYFLWTEDTYIYTSKMRLTMDNLDNIVIRYVAGMAGSLVALIVLVKAFSFTPAFLRSQAIACGQDTIFIYILQAFVFMGISHYAHDQSWPITQPLADIAGIILGIAVAYLCRLVGHLLSKSEWSARLLFGR